MTRKFISMLLCGVLLFSTFSIGSTAEKISAAALHGENFLVKEDMEAYNKLSPITDVWLLGGSIANGAPELSLEEGGNSYGGSGKSLRCNYDFSELTSSTFSFYSNRIIYNEDENGNPLGESSRFGFWISTDKDIKLQVRAVDSSSDWQRYTITTDYLDIPRGESFVELDWSDFIPSDGAVYHRYYSLLQTQFIITKSNSNNTGTVYIDEIGIIPVQTRLRTHGDGFNAAALDSSKWTVKNNSAVIDAASATHYCTDSTDEMSLRIDYGALSSDSVPSFYYNGDIRLRDVEPYIFSDASVLSFWSRSSHPVNLRITYMDTAVSGGLVQCKSIIVSIPEGEHITAIKMSDFVPDNMQLTYRWIYQLQFSVLPQGSETEGGSLYLDAIGFYNTDTENQLRAKLDEIEDVNVNTAARVQKVSDFVLALSQDESEDITPYTYIRYERMMAQLDELAPYICDISCETDSKNERGSLKFAAVLESEPEGWSVASLGAVVHREKLVDEPYLLTLDTANALSADCKPYKTAVGYINKIELKSENPSEEENGTYVGDGYFGTAYIVRPYAVLRSKSTHEAVVIYGRTVSSAKSAYLTDEMRNSANAFDGDSETAWSAGAGTYVLDCNFSEAKSFNAISFEEVGNTPSDYAVCSYRVDIIDGEGGWRRIYSQDEMGKRIGLLDRTYTTDRVRVTVTAESNAAISEIEFITVSPNDSFMRNSSYFIPLGYDSAQIAERCPAVFTLTDVILFDFGSWRTDGSFVYNTGNNEFYGETQLKRTVDSMRENENCPDIWFCIQNYDKNEIADIAANEGVTENEAKNRLLATAQARQKLIDYCLYICETYSLTGIDIDYEYPDTPVQWSNYDLFIKELSAALHTKGYKLSLALSAFNINYLTKEAIDAIDAVNMMAYDSPLSDGHGRHNGYNGALKQINYYLDLGFKPSQLILGLGFYGKTADGSDFLNYASLCRRYPKGMTADRNWHGQYYCAGVTANADKTMLAWRMGLGGVFSYTVRSDVELSNPYSLTASVNRTIDRLTTK